jgi:hypothetical protein
MRVLVIKTLNPAAVLPALFVCAAVLCCYGFVHRMGWHGRAGGEQL